MFYMGIENDNIPSNVAQREDKIYGSITLHLL